MSNPDPSQQQPASLERRLDAVQAAMDERGMEATEGVETNSHLATESWLPINGARVVAKAWADPAFRARLMANGLQAIGELGLSMHKHHRHLVALENSPAVHNVICCTLCSCTAISLIGIPPDWYKSLDYRARIVRESRTVLKEMGLDLAPGIELRVWDTTADTRYIVLPERPAYSAGWNEEQLAAIVTRDGMIGVTQL